MKIESRAVARVAPLVKPNYRGSSGFTMIELLVALAVFLVIGGAALMLFKMHVSQFTNQQNQVGLNTSMRNALTQMEIDVANAGTGYYVTADKASFPIGLTIVSGGGAGCNVGTTYTAACFDKLNIISTNQNVNPSHPDDGTGAGCTNTTGTAGLVIPPTNPATTAAAYAAQFATGDQVLWASGLNYNTAVLTGPGVVAGTEVSLPHQPTAAAATGNSLATDPLQLSAANDPNLTTSFCAGTGVVVKLAAPIIYGVDTTTNPADPQLYRQVGVGGPQSVIADQIVGFRIVATMLNNTVVSNFVPATAQYNQIRTINISLIGRTPPNQGGNFINTWDGGPYRIESMSVTANPRNLSMND